MFFEINTCSRGGTSNAPDFMVECNDCVDQNCLCLISINFSLNSMK